MGLIDERVSAAELARARVLADLGERALALVETGALFEEASARAAALLGIARLGVFEIGGRTREQLRLRAGSGFAPELPASLLGNLAPAERLTRLDGHVALDGLKGAAAPIYADGWTFGAVLALLPDGRALDVQEEEFLLALGRLLGASVVRRRAEERLRSSEARMELAQKIAHLGSYDWDIATDTNRWSPELFRIYGYEPEAFDPTYQKFLSLVHPEDRDQVVAVHQQAYRDGEPFSVEGRIVRSDGELRTLHSNGVVITDGGGKPVRMAGICLDVTERKHNEELARKAHETELRRKGAFEINDSIVQGLCAIIYSLELEDAPQAKTSARRTLDAARRMMNELMGPGTTPRPGDLVRVVSPEAEHARAPSTPTARDDKRKAQVPPQAAAPERTIRIVVADDSEDLRGCIQGLIDLCSDLRVVGQAANGVEAVQLCEDLKPDVVLLDLSMPVMDGLEALPLIRARSPQTSILVLSGFDSRRMQRPALGLGAAGYIQKGGDPGLMVQEIRALCRR